jgi:hypothetical protein
MVSQYEDGPDLPTAAEYRRATDDIPSDAGPDYDLSSLHTEVRRAMRKQLLGVGQPEFLDLVYRAITLSEHEAIRRERARLRQTLIGAVGLSLKEREQ